MIYLASPYSAPTPLEQEKRFLAVSAYAATCMLRGQHVYSPIAHWHTINRLAPTPIPYETFLACDFEMISKCEKLVVLCLDGWSESTGVQLEITEADRLNIPVYYLKP